MYHVHFGLEKRVFDDGIAQDAAVHLGARQQSVVADCSVALSSSDAVVVLTGRPGTGKTTLAGTALRTTSTRLALGALSGGTIGTVDLLEWLLTEFGFARERGTRAERLQSWRQFLSEASTTDSRVFVVVERAEDLGVEGLRSLAALTAADLNGCPGANLLLLGDAALLDVLAAGELEALRQRIRFRHTLEPLTAAELALYVGHHVEQAGGEPMQLFPPETLAVLHAYTDGIPRLVNNLAETAASVAAARRAAHVTPAVVAEVARKFLGLSDPSPHDAGSAAPPAAVPIAAAVATPDTTSIPAPAATPVAATATAPVAAPVAAVDEGVSIVRRTSTDSGNELPILTDAVDVPARAADDALQGEPSGAPLGEPRSAPSDGYADVEALPDISAAMAETLFGDSDLDLLGAALAAGSWDDVETPADLLDDLGRAPSTVPAADGDATPFASTARAGRGK